MENTEREVRGKKEKGRRKRKKLKAGRGKKTLTHTETQRHKGKGGKKEERRRKKEKPKCGDERVLRPASLTSSVHQCLARTVSSRLIDSRQRRDLTAEVEKNHRPFSETGGSLR
ncbi:MAG: hypothetical protein OXU79_14020 [Gemmatimonadota bacterium]|nr:hypothetical protein [Gemmatimonadota bacterium]